MTTESHHWQHWENSSFIPEEGSWGRSQCLLQSLANKGQRWNCVLDPPLQVSSLIERTQVISTVGGPGALADPANCRNASRTRNPGCRWYSPPRQVLEGNTTHSWSQDGTRSRYTLRPHSLTLSHPTRGRSHLMAFPSITAWHFLVQPKIYTS